MSFRPIRRRRTSIGVEPSSQVLDILEYACGLILGLALISTEDPDFEDSFYHIRSLNRLNDFYPMGINFDDKYVFLRYG